MDSFVVRGATVIDPSQNVEGEKDVLVVKGRVKDLLRPNEKVADAIEFDASGMWLTPGLIDLHVHLREPGFEWKETIQTGSQAAAFGGFTSICAMPNTSPSNDCAEITEFIVRRSKEADLVKVLPIGAVSKGLKGKEMAPLTELMESGCVAFSDDGEPIHDSGMMRRALEWCKMLGATISCHEEDKCLSCGGSMNEGALATEMGLSGWPSVAEEVMIARDIEIARFTGGKVHICHVSTARGVELIRRAKGDGINITAEATPHHLTLTEDATKGYNTNAKMSPPLRTQADVEGLIAGIKDGTIDAVASDHAPHELDKKRIEFGQAAFGILGLQTSLPLMLEFIRKGTLSRKRAIELLTGGPARAFGLKVGTLRIGADADLIVIDPNRKYRLDAKNIKSLSKNSPFVDRELEGAARDVWVNGIQKVSEFTLLSPKRG